NDVIGWVETPIEPATPQFKVSLAHNSTGIPGIAYTYIDKLMYATNIAGGWTTTEIDTAGYYPDLIFDRTDKPLIVYNSNDECLSLNVVKLAGIGLEPFNIADLNNDKAINFKDFAVMAENWMTILPQPDSSAGDFNRDATVDALDLKWLGCNWLHIND
ncbi:MAG: dockerin type I domain-containing protein, partial [Phycisphaerae bacterium]